MVYGFIERSGIVQS